MTVDPLIRRLADRRRAANLTQAHVARALNCSRSAVMMWETGHRIPPLPMLRAYAELLDAPLDLVELDEDGDNDRDPQVPGQLRTIEQRRRRVLELATRGHAVAEMATRIGLSERSVHRHVAAVRGRT